jgi:hypothetical protein
MADTLSYLLMGLAVTAISIIVFIGSLIIRQRNLKKDIELIQQLKDE